MAIKSGGTRSASIGWTPISDSIAYSDAKVLIEEFFERRKMRPERIWGHINGNTKSTHFNKLGDSFITFIFILVQRLKRGFNKYVSLFILDLPTQTCFSIIKNNIFKIGNSFEISDGQQDIPKGKIPLDLHVCSVPSIFMHCLGCTALLKKAGLASEVSESCLKNSPKKMQT